MILEDSADHVVTEIVSILLIKIPGVSHVTVGVDSWTTCVPFDVFAVHGDEGLLGLWEKVRVDLRGSFSV